MALAKITLIGLNAYTDGSIWSEFELPSILDVDIAKNEIMMQCGEFQLLYPDANFLTEAIGHFSKKWFHNFERWAKAEQLEYEALFNLDVTSEITDSSTRFNSSNSSGTATSKVSAFDSSSFENSNQITNSGNGSNSENYDNRHIEVRRGNQGVTMSQELLEAEYNVRKWNIYQHIADVFAAEFCVSIYE